MKKAFKDVKSSNSTAGGVNEQSIEHLTQLLLEKRRQQDIIIKKKQQIEIDALNKSIEEFNKVSDTQPKISSFLKRDQVLLGIITFFIFLSYLANVSVNKEFNN
jgi:hypothetical protein